MLRRSRRKRADLASQNRRYTELMGQEQTTPKRRLALLIEYDGGRYSGWQRQNNARSIQGTLEHAYYEITGKFAEIIGSGRTDAGVHGMGQVAHIILPDDFNLPENRITMAFNANLPRDIRILWSSILRRDFHARFDAVMREYIYTVMQRPSVFDRWYSWQTLFSFDPKKLQETARIFVGEHDFTTFSKLNTDTKNYVCRVEECVWEEHAAGVWQMTIRANRFVYGMVRSVVGAMMEVARGKRTVEDVAASLPARDRSLNSPLAPAKGLYLAHIYYEADPFEHYWQMLERVRSSS